MKTAKSSREERQRESSEIFSEDLCSRVFPSRLELVKLADHSSSRLKSFFQTNQFKTGYATHGLFPYRGKFHPQMIKALLNVLDIKPGHVVLDPMAGSSTVAVEAN